jgi:hypothetical protein
LIHEQYHAIINKNKLKHRKNQKMLIQDHQYNRENTTHYRLLNIELQSMLKAVMHLDQPNGTRGVVQIMTLTSSKYY